MWRERARRLLLPDPLERDPAFRDEMKRLAHIGLRVAGVATFSLAVFLLIARLWFTPNPYTFRLRLTQGVILSVIGIVALILARIEPLYSHARLLSTLAGFSVAATLIWFSLLMSIHDPTADDFIPGQMTMVLLLGVIAVPLRPLQMLLFGAAVAAWYIIAGNLTNAYYGAPTGPIPINVAFLTALTLLSAGLAAVLHRQRISNYRIFQASRQAETQSLLAENAASLGRLAAAISHELNTPLGALLSSVDTLLLLSARQAQGGSAEQQQRLIRLQADLRRSIQESVERLRQLVTRMQRFTNLDKAEVQTANINDLLTDVTALLASEVKDKAQVDLDLHPVQPVVCRPAQLSAVFSSLLSNAVNSVNGNGRVQIATRQKDATIEVEIRDNGHGLDQKELSGIFDPGFRVSGSRIAASNWSLFGSRQIIREHGGDIRIDSARGQGTAVFVTLPCQGCKAALEME